LLACRQLTPNFFVPLALNRISKMNRKLDQYIIDHSSPEDPVLEDLFRQTHIRFVNPNMATGHLQGKLLEFISYMISPENILEIGTFTGYSAICLAKGLKAGGKLITIESNDELSSFSQSYINRAGLDSKITQITGNAQDVIPGLDMIFDLVFIDGDKREYTEYFQLAIGKVRPGGFILVDNVLWGGKVLENKTADQQARGVIDFNEMIRRDMGLEIVMLPVRDGLMIIRKKT
jgi:predicted O-methyltransferase YrrM